MHRRRLAHVSVLIALATSLCSCSSDDEAAETPGLDPRGTVLTTVKPKRQDLTNQISLAGKVTINPVFGIVAPVGGELRFVKRTPVRTPATRPLWVATVWDDDIPRRIEIPKDTVMAGRLLEDRAEVTAGMPIVSARYSGYGIVADIDSAQAYRISGSVKTVRAQIKNGPGPFACSALGTIAALPEGTFPEPEAPPTPAAGKPSAPAAPQAEASPPPEGSESTGLRLVCTAPDSVKMINGAAVTLDVITAKATKVWVLPVEAVAGTQGRGKVDVVGPDRTRKTVDVALGLTDGKVVQIKSGLRGDEEIAVPGPNLPTADPAAGADNPSEAPK